MRKVHNTRELFVHTIYVLAEYIGCFKDDEKRLLKYKITYIIEITMSKCIQHSSGPHTNLFFFGLRCDVT
jgi:hypothetical protein